MSELRIKKNKFIDQKLFDFISNIDNPLSDELIYLYKDMIGIHNLKIEHISVGNYNYEINVKVTDGSIHPMKFGTFITNVYGKNSFNERDLHDFLNKYNSNFNLRVRPTTLKSIEELNWNLNKAENIGGVVRKINNTNNTNNSNSKDYNTNNTNNHSKNFNKPIVTKKTKEVKIYPRTKIEVQSMDFTFDALDVRKTFLSLVRQTYPMGYEDDVVSIFSEIGLTKDKYGNYYKIVGKNKKPRIMFTSHLDTYDSKKVDEVILYSEDRDGVEYITTDGKSILGADDKAGVTVMLNMITKGVEGLYYFFVSEESGGIGSSQLAKNFHDYDYLSKVKIAVSFDRKGETDVIVKQLKKVSCSDAFAERLCEMFNSNGLDFKPCDGYFTDSASFLDFINECTNISVGYYNEHKENECQNMTYLIKLCDVIGNIKWSELSIQRTLFNDKDILSYKSFFIEVEEYGFKMKSKIDIGFTINNIIFECNNVKIDDFFNDISFINYLQHKYNLSVSFTNKTFKLSIPPIQKHSRWLKYINLSYKKDFVNITSVDISNENIDLEYSEVKEFLKNSIDKTVNTVALDDNLICKLPLTYQTNFSTIYLLSSFIKIINDKFNFSETFVDYDTSFGYYGEFKFDSLNDLDKRVVTTKQNNEQEHIDIHDDSMYYNMYSNL